MKKTLTINLNGIVFNIDDDAYETLSAYLNELEKHFADDEREEIIKDIEDRIAELFTERMHGRNVVDASDVASVIETMGQPNQFDDEAAEPNAGATASKSSQRKFRKFYRDGDDRLIGGVAAGLAAYIGWDTTLVRILLLLLLLFSAGWTLLFYILLWIIVPEAKTTAQRLEMQGIEPNLENIKKYMPKRETIQHVGNRALEVISWILKFAAIFISGCIGIGLFMAVIGIVIAIFTLRMMYIPGMFGSWIDIALLVSCALFLLCPAIGLVLLCIRLINKNAPHRPWISWTLLIVWIVSLFAIIGTAIKSTHSPFVPNIAAAGATITEQLFDNLNDDSGAISEVRTCAPFSSIEAERAVRVVLSQGDTTSVVVKAQDHMLRNIETNVENGVLHIENNNHNNRTRTLPVVYVTTPTLTSIEASEASFIKSETPFEHLQTLTLEASEASRIQLTGSAEQVIIEASGASRTQLTGSAERVIIKASEASYVNVADMTITAVEATASEASSINIGQVEKARLTAESAAAITYEGQPSQLERNCQEASHIEQKSRTSNEE
ncbi:MAG: GIN domain-containing protein [Paludibacteraceae bacterium]